MSSLWRDVRYALRTFGRSKGFAAIAILTLAVGIGVNAAVFTIINAVLFKGFPFDKNDLIVYVGSRDINRNFPGGPVSYPDFRDWRAQAKSFVDLAAANVGGTRVNLNDDAGSAESYITARMTANSFKVIGQKPVIGRDFTTADEIRGAPPVAILTYGLWERRYGKDPAIVGRTVRMSGVPTTIIGVMPREVVFPTDLDLWVPMVPRPDTERREARNLMVFGRLVGGATVQSARAEMTTIARNLQTAYPLTNQNFAAVVRTYSENFIGPRITLIFTAMLVAVGFVLLIACANVANLLLARAVGRAREISIRIALGASRWRLIRQLLVESLLLSAAGGILGWLIAIWAARTFDVVTLPLGRPSWMDFSMDYRVLAYLMGVSIATGIVFGLVPALRLSKLDVNTTLKDGGRGASVGHRGRHLSGLLVVGEMALAIVLLAGAGLMIRSFLNIYRAPLGINGIANVLMLRVTLPPGKYPQPDNQISFYDRLRTHLAAVAGVESVSIAFAPPTGGSMPFSYELDGAPSDPQRRPSVAAVPIDQDYFYVMGVAVLQGRPFSETDGVSGPPVVIVNQQFARKFWPGQDPLGKRLRLFTAGKPEPWLTTVGIAPNIVQNDVTSSEIEPLIYLPFREKPLPGMAVLARTTVPPGSLKNVFSTEIHAVDPDIPINNLWTMEERLARNSWFYQIIGSMFAIFAGIALLLASVGLYALMAHSVGQRTQEIGVRMTVGASAGNIHRLVFFQGMRQLAIGLVIGLAAAFGVMRVLRSTLVQVSPADPTTFIVAAVVLTCAAVLGCWLPARRAMKVDPMVALRYE